MSHFMLQPTISFCEVQWLIALCTLTTSTNIMGIQGPLPARKQEGESGRFYVTRCEFVDIQLPHMNYPCAFGTDDLCVTTVDCIGLTN